ncbi:MAG: fluoride efflux transporter CrcB [Chloroflexota bacterium]
MEKALMVGAGGFVGSVLRYWVSGYVQQWSKDFTFPLGTLTVNALGCLLIGFLSHLAETRGLFTAETRALVLIGFLGGFTTFSTFGNETLNLARAQQTWLAVVNVGASLLLGLGAVWLGRALAYWIWR